MRLSRCAATMLREGSLPSAQAVQDKERPRGQPTLSSFICVRMYADTASQIATTSGKQGKEGSGSRPASSQSLGKGAVPPFHTARLTLLPGQGWSRNGDVGRAPDQGCGHLTPRKGWHPRAQDVICQPGSTRGSRGKEQRFSQRRLVQSQGLIYSRGISSWLTRAL